MTRDELIARVQISINNLQTYRDHIDNSDESALSNLRHYEEAFNHRLNFLHDLAPDVAIVDVTAARDLGRFIQSEGQAVEPDLDVFDCLPLIQVEGSDLVKIQDFGFEAKYFYVQTLGLRFYRVFEDTTKAMLFKLAMECP